MWLALLLLPLILLLLLLPLLLLPAVALILMLLYRHVRSEVASVKRLRRVGKEAVHLI